jgi:hypothetical protein
MGVERGLYPALVRGSPVGYMIGPKRPRPGAITFMMRQIRSGTPKPIGKAIASAGDDDPVGWVAGPEFSEASNLSQRVSIGPVTGPVIGPVQYGRFRHP